MSLTQDAVEYRAHTTPTTSRTAKEQQQTTEPEPFPGLAHP
jgi:hypothetical protein